MKKLLFLVCCGLILSGYHFSVKAETLNCNYYFGPYFGYHFFLDGRDYKDKPELGFKYEKALQNPWSIEIGLGYVPTKNEVTGKDKNMFTFGINGIYSFYNSKLFGDKLIPYLAGGISGDLCGGNVSAGPDIAAGLKYTLDENTIIKPEIKYINLFNDKQDIIASLAIGFAIGEKNAGAAKKTSIQKPKLYNFENAKKDSAGKLLSVTLKINFATDKFDVTPEYFSEIEQFSNYIKDNPEIKVEIQGHTDNVGNAEYNQTLSESRAQMVKNIFINNYQISADRISAKGYGQTNPIASNDTDEGKKQNRRIEAAIIR